MIIGTVGELWRYTVWSMGVARLGRCPVGLQVSSAPVGYMPGKRHWYTGIQPKVAAGCASFLEADHGQLAHMGMSVGRCGRCER